MKIVCIGIFATFLLVLTGCESKDSYASFEGVVTQVEESNIIVEPFENEEIRQSGSEVSIGVSTDLILRVGDEVKITHEGPVMESHPLQIKLIELEKTN